MRTLYALARLVAVLVVPGAVVAQAAPAVPELLLEFADAQGGAEARVGRLDTSRVQVIMRLVGLEDPGPPIRVIVAGEHSELGRRTPSWIAGFAHGDSDTIVLFPARSTQYPHDSLEEVLHHEVAHILTDRAARGQPLPRWFSEGLATVAEGQWRREDRRQLALALTARAPVRMREVDTWFLQGPTAAARAYAVSAAFVRDLLETHGRDAAARILAGVGAGEPFEAAFARTTGSSLQAQEVAFDARMGSWERWVPLLTSPYVLWIAVTGLALLAIWRRRQSRAAMRRRWDAEEAAAIHTAVETDDDAEEDTEEEPFRRDTIH
jgi:hypothetical protein